MATLAALLPMGVIGPTQIILIVVLIVILFGGRKIPELMRGMGRGVKEFKDAVNKDYSQEVMGDEVTKDKPAAKDEK